MIGTWRWNAIAALTFAALIFLLSWRHNPIATAGYRTAISFAIGFAVTYAVRWMLGKALAEPWKTEERTDEAPFADDEREKGRAIDYVTPDEGPEGVSAFEPLSPPKLAKTEEPLDPGLLAKAVRQMSDK